MTSNDLKKIFPELDSLSSDDVSMLCEYHESVTMLGKQGLNLEFNNKDRFHAAIVMSTIFNEAKNSIKIFADNFNGDICDSEIYLTNLKNAVKERKVSLEVIFKDNPNQNSKGFKLLKELKDSDTKISVKLLDKDFKVKTVAEGLYNFTVGDNNMLRYETDALNFKAICNFDDAKIANTLLNNFSVLSIKSKEISC